MQDPFKKPAERETNNSILILASELKFSNSFIHECLRTAKKMTQDIKSSTKRTPCNYTTFQHLPQVTLFRLPSQQPIILSRDWPDDNLGK